ARIERTCPLLERAVRRTGRAAGILAGLAPPFEGSARSFPYLQSRPAVRRVRVGGYMQTHLTDWARQLPRAEEAQAILRSCVHCGFCNATCRTYLDQGDELDGPRGRIYLIKMFLEGEATSELTQHHLARCLSCRNCETTCPSGVKYHALLDIGRSALEPRVQRPLKARAVRVALARILPEPGRVQALLGAARAARPFLPD